MKRYVLVWYRLCIFLITLRTFAGALQPGVTYSDCKMTNSSNPVLQPVPRGFYVSVESKCTYTDRGQQTLACIVLELVNLVANLH